MGADFPRGYTFNRTNFLRLSGMGKPFIWSGTNMGIRRFDWPACFQVFGNRPDKAPHQDLNYAAAHPTDD
jgi:hypothetical protein